MNEMMKAVVVHRPGDPSVLKIEAAPVPKVRPGWSLVRVRGFGVNHSEIFTRQGLSPGVAFPRILGTECVGTIAESSDTTRLPVGRRVVSIMGEMGRAFGGSYAEFCLLPNEQIIPAASDLPWPTLAAVPETFYTPPLARCRICT
ncbi:alcohol dehydrogenase catalytic domain-containing protein [Pseudoramibacter sp. HA2172]|uniref:alcohol dehydrogenase catalytic domain-containing protein n=1 Tax=Pseudoramibacter faecis TaxID=3108534 RepID=UPI002E7858AB|nr:alcohol dehydrogenase catalytic domain-containing protein [Pseudoramibacter sp. HA2172]